MNYDILRKPVTSFYYIQEKTKEQLTKSKRLDAAGLELYDAALIADYMVRAKTASDLRRTYHRSYLTRSADGRKMFLNAFEDIGARDVVPATDSNRGWYTDGFYEDTLSGVVVVMGCHKVESKTSGWADSAGLFMAGTRHSEWDGVTLYTKMFDIFDDAARYADECARQEAEECCEEDEKNQREQKADDLKQDVRRFRRACLTLLRDMRPIRKGVVQYPDTVCAVLRNQVQQYLNDISECRQKIGELS